MPRLLPHVLLPALAPAAVVGLYFTPTHWLGCVNRGLAAVAIVMVSLAVGIALAVRALRMQRAGEPGTGRWALSAAILALPAALVLGPLG